MAKALNDVLKTSPGMSVTRPGNKVIFANKYGYTPKPGDEKGLIGIHSVLRSNDRVGNTDDIFKAAKIRHFDRAASRMGYNNHDDEKIEFAAAKNKEKQEIDTPSEQEDLPVSDMEQELTDEQWMEMFEEADAILETSFQAATSMAQALADRFYHPHFVHQFDHNNKKHYGVLSKQLYDTGDDKYRYHLVSIVHPSPPKAWKSPAVLKDPPKTVRFATKPMKEATKLAATRGSSLGYPDGHKGPETPGQKKSKRFSWLKKVMETAEVNELSKATLGRYVKKAAYDSNRHSIEGGKATAAAHRASGEGYKKHFKRSAHHYGRAANRAVGISMAVDRLTKKEEENLDERAHRRFMPRRQPKSTFQTDTQNPKGTNTQYDGPRNVTEKLDQSDPASTYIHDFVHSDNKRFKGKPKKERIRMALGAYYHNRNKAGAPA